MAFKYGRQWRLISVAEISSVALALALLCAPSAWAQRPGNFIVLGPGGGGTLYNPAISPHDPLTVLTSCDMSGDYITHDGGQTWRMFNLRGGARSFAFDPADSKVIYALGGGLWRSSDTGETWQLLVPHPNKVKGLSDASDEADVSFMTEDERSPRLREFGPVNTLAVDPQDHKWLSMVVGAGLWHSKDGGDHWSQDDDFPSAILHIALVHKPGEHGAPKVLVAGDGGFWLSRGFRPLQLPSPEGVTVFSSEALDVIHDKVLMLGVANGALYQAWGDATEKTPAVTWRALKLPGENGKITTAASGHDGKTIYASFNELQLDHQTWQGVARSEDLGEHWTLVLKDAGSGAPNFSGDWSSQSLGSGWGGPALGLVVAESDHQVIFATDEGGAMKSPDGGGHWASVNSQVAPDGGAATSGLDLLTNYGVHFDPFDAQRMFVSYTDIGLMRSDNRGGSWWSSSADVPRAWRNTTYWMVFDPAVRGRIWAAMSGNHDLPRPRMWRHLTVDKLKGGIVVSLDGGKHWTVSGRGMPQVAPTHIVLDPKSSPQARTLYVATMGRGVFKSVDGGATWVAKNQGMTQEHPLAWRLSLAADGTLYVVIARKSGKAAAGSPAEGALYRSHDGAETWERVPLPDGVNGPNGLAIDPHEPSRMYLAAWAREIGLRGQGGGVFSTTDGGAHWSTSLNIDQHVYDVTLNPGNASELYAVGFGSSAWHSTDRGQHWQRIAGYNFKAGARVTPDPMHPGMVYITTFGGGVWYGRVDGKPGIEDVATKEVAP